MPKKDRTEYHKNYYACEEGYKNNKIRCWRKAGMILKENEEWESIFYYYMACETCENCDVILTDEVRNTKTRRSLDHCHVTGHIRNILCVSCNSSRG
jgi:hypothetical protein